MKQAKDILIVVCLVLFTAILAPWAWYSRTMAQAAKDAAIHADGLVGEARLAAKESVTVSKDTDTAVKNLNTVVVNVGGLVPKFGSVADASTTLIGKLRRTTDVASTRIAALSTTQAKIDTAIDQYEQIPGHLNGALDNLAELTDSTNRFIADPATASLRDHLSGAVENIGLMAKNSATIVAHTDAWMFPPKYSGKHPFWHGVGQYTERALKIAPGLAGAVALAKGN